MTRRLWLSVAVAYLLLVLAGAAVTVRLYRQAVQIEDRCQKFQHTPTDHAVTVRERRRI